VSVLRETKADWTARQRKKEADAQAAAANAAIATASGTDTKAGDKDKDGKKVDVTNAVKLNTNGAGAPVFDPGDTFKPPHTELAPTIAAKKISDAALCLIWVNNDCEIATLDEKYLRLNGTIDQATHEWHVTDRAKLDSLLQSAEAGARQGIAFAQKAEVDPSVLAMIYERGSYLRIQTDDASALEALRQYWRCALLGNMCWQLAHAHKAQPVDLSKEDAPDDKTTDKNKEKDKDKDKAKPTEAAASDKDKSNKDSQKKAPAPPPSNAEVTVTPSPVNEAITPAPPRALPVVEDTPPNPPTPPAPPVPVPAPTPVAAPAPAPSTAITAPAPAVIDESNIPVAHVAKMEDYGPVGTNPVTNVPPQTPQPPRASQAPKSDNSDGNSF